MYLLAPQKKRDEIYYLIRNKTDFKTSSKKNIVQYIVNLINTFSE